MRVLIACEFSGTVRDAFLSKGHDAWSCDILPDIRESDRHLQCYAEEVLREKWDLVIAHPPCTYLSTVGTRWFSKSNMNRRTDRLIKVIDACNFFLQCLNANSPRVCVENPLQHCYAKERIKVPYTQIINPWMFGHKEKKRTCLWLKGLPKLVPTNVIPEEDRVVWGLHTFRGCQKAGISVYISAYVKSITFEGIAKAMADQWG